MRREGESLSKRDSCFICKKPFASFCNSHTIPQFVLRNIAVDGNVHRPSIFLNPQDRQSTVGIKGTNTFRVLCSDCDSRYFKGYENPERYSNVPTGEILAQIALKNFISRHAKRIKQQGLAQSMMNYSGASSRIFSDTEDVHKLDISEYEQQYEYARNAVEKGWSDRYYLQLSIQLDYVVPIAFQDAIALAVGFDQCKINDLRNLSPKYRVQELHICIFPLKSNSQVFAFTRNDDKRYRSFFKELRLLDTKEQLQVINYLVLAHSEEVFFSPKLDNKVFGNPSLKDVVSKTMVIDVPSTYPWINQETGEELVLEAFTCNHAFQTTCLLSAEFALH